MLGKKNNISLNDFLSKIIHLSHTQVLVIALVIGAFYLGVLYNKVQNFENSAAQAVRAAVPESPDTQPVIPENAAGPIAVSLDDDPVLGDKNAPVTLIDFSDYECPFCKRHFEQTFQEIKREYIDTGKVKMVYRDLPLGFHDPLATKQAIAANCAREQGGDETYYNYHDEIFKRTQSNGNGMAVDELYTIASDLGLNQPDFRTCLDTDKYKDEVQKDLDDAAAYGATGTPTFFIGKSSGDVIEGTKIVGAQPFAAFKTIIDENLN
jgi:protein-disulfide isomerase